MRRKILVIIVVGLSIPIVFSVLIYISGIASTTVITPVTALTGTTAKYVIGDKVNISNVIYQVTNVTTRTIENDGITHAQGTFVVVRVVIENMNSIPAGFDAHQFALADYDKNGNVRIYSVKTATSNWFWNMWQTLQPNVPLTEDVWFDVSFDKNMKYALGITSNQNTSSIEAVYLGMGKDFS